MRLRPGEAPIVAPDVVAFCLEVGPEHTAVTIAAAVAELRERWGLAVRCRPTEILFDGDQRWWQTVAALPWDAVYARHMTHLETTSPVIIEYPLQGLNGIPAALLASGKGLSGCQPRLAGVVASPETSVGEIAALATWLHAQPGVGSYLAIEVMACGRQQLLVSRDELGRAEGLTRPAPGHVAVMTLIDAKGFAFPVRVGMQTTRLFNARVTNLSAVAGELQEAGVTGFLVVQSDLSSAEAEAFRVRGLPGLATFVDRQHSTTGHIFRGVS